MPVGTSSFDPTGRGGITVTYPQFLNILMQQHTQAISLNCLWGEALVSANYADRNHDQGQQLTKADQNATTGFDKETGVDIDEIQTHNPRPLGWAETGMNL